MPLHRTQRRPARPGHTGSAASWPLLATALICAILLALVVERQAYAQAGSRAGAKPVSTDAGARAEKDSRENPVLARVNRHEIRLSDVYKQIESLSLGDQIDVRGEIGRFTESVVTEEILFQAVLSGGFPAEADLRGKLKTQVVEYLIEKHVRGKIAITDEDIRRYYTQNRDLVRGLHVRVRQILLKSRAQCEQLRKRIRSEEDFAREAAALSLDKKSAAQGGDMGFLMPVLDERSLGFELDFFKMKVGEMRIYDSALGCHLVRLTEILDPPDLPFAKIQEIVRPTLEREQEQALLRKLIERASRTVSVERLDATVR